MRLKKLFLSAVVCGLIAIPARAQNDDFKAFRERMMGNYNDFRKGLLDEYANFLDQAWTNLEEFKKFEKKSEPKLDKPPVADPVAKPTFKPVPKPKPKPQPKPEPKPVVKPEPKKEPVIEPQKEPEKEPVVEPEPKKEPEKEPVVEPEPKKEPEKEPVVEPEPKKEDPVAEPKPKKEPKPKAEKPAKEPKPKAEKPAKEPKPKAEKPAKEPKPEKPKKEPTPKAEPTPTPKPEPKPEPKPTPKPEPKQPEPAPDPFFKRTQNVEFSLYGIPFSIPKIKVDGTLGSADRAKVAKFWKMLLKADTQKSVEALTEASKSYSLGSWCTLKAVETFAAQCVTQGDIAAQRTLTHFLMVSLGYDVRIATGGNTVALLVPFDETVYSNPYFTINGKLYYMYPANAIPQSVGVQTCSIPSDKDMGSTFDLVINPGYRLPTDPMPYAVSHDDLRLEGSINRNLINLMKDYPMTAIPIYASSNPDEDVRHSILEQLRPQIEGLDALTAANELLHFVQKAFEYKTDAEQFGTGVEKTFFCEEMFFYPFCDCEDRAVFYSYLVHNLLGLDVVLLEYPGHECTAVAFPEPLTGSATSISYQGRTWYVCDPTYIGSDIGMCIPRYASVQPQVSTWY